MIAHLANQIRSARGDWNGGVPTAEALEEIQRTIDKIAEQVAIQGAFTTDGRISRYGEPYTRSVTRQNWDKHGETPSIIDFGGRSDDSTDNTPALLAAWEEADAVRIPFGRYRFYSSIPILNRANKSIVGDGWGSVLVADGSIPGNFMDVSGSTNIVLKDLQIDGMDFPDISAECIYGDGTEENPVYGNIKLINLLVTNWKSLVFGIGANLGKTAQNITYDGIWFINCGHGSHGANTIDTGSSGIKQGYKITGCKFFYITQPTVNPGNAIFAGHGTNFDFEIEGNHIWNAPTTGINIHNRPFIGEETTLMNAMVKGNLISNPKWNGISIFGGYNIQVEGNLIRGAGRAELETVETRCGIFISTQHSGVTPDLAGGRVIQIQNNIIVDGQIGDPTMLYGILESFDSPGARASGQIMGNHISGWITAEMLIPSGTLFSILRSSPVFLNWGIGAATDLAKASFTAPGDLRAAAVTSNLFAQVSIASAQTAGGFVVGFCSNIRFDGTNWVTGFDGASNGWSAIILDYGSGLVKFLGAAANGGTARTYTTAQFLAAVWMSIEPSTNTVNFHGSSGVRLASSTIQFDAAGGVAQALFLGTDNRVSWGQLDISLVGDGSVSNAELVFINTLSENVQDALNDFRSRIEDLEAADFSNFVTKSQHNAHDHQYDPTATDPLSHTGSANPPL